MSVAYEARNFIHDGSYPAIGDSDSEAKHFTEAAVSALGSYNAASTILADGQAVVSEQPDRHLLPEESRVDISAADLPQLPSMDAPGPPQSKRMVSESDAQSPSTRVRAIPKPEREVSKHPDGKYYCTWNGCSETQRAFARRCEWSKHMDKHERPYVCEQKGCEKLPGFTYSGGLLRHEREVHGKHGGPKNTVNCPHVNCKRHTGKGFSRQENLNEHLRRVHTEGASPGEDVPATSDNDSEKAGSKRKRTRRSSSVQDDDITDLREEIKRLRRDNDDLQEVCERFRRENTDLRATSDQHRLKIEELQRQCDEIQRQHLAVMAQVTEVQDPLRLNNNLI